MTIVELLKQARGLVAKGWTVGVLARGTQGNQVPVESGAACTWCLMGALVAVEKLAIRDATHLGPRCGPTDWNRAMNELDQVLVSRGYYNGSVTWNDEPGRTQAEVLELFDQTIKELESDAQDNPNATK